MNQTNKNDQKRALKEKQKNAAEQRLLIVFLAAAAAACCALTLYSIDNYEPMLFARRIVMIAFGVLTLASAVWWSVSTARKTDFSYRLLNPGFCFGLFACLTVGAWLYMNSYVTISIRMLVIACIAAGALYFLFCLFRRDFFIYALMTLIGIFAVRATVNTRYVSIVALTLCFLLPILEGLALLLFRVGHGTLFFAGKKYRLPANFRYYPMVVTALMTLAGGIFSLVFSTYLSYYVIAFCVVFLILTVIYTIETVYFS